MDAEKREFEFRYAKRWFLPFLIFAAAWGAVAFVATLVWPATYVLWGDVVLSRNADPVGMSVIFLSAPVIWQLTHLPFELKGKAIMHSDRVTIILEDARHEIPYRKILQVYSHAARGAQWHIRIKGEEDVVIYASARIKFWRKSLGRFMSALSKKIRVRGAK